ncbi:DNA repair endonuclease UVH1 isoform X1 [Apium graveolens]|uniref:DNA repair endonuclease UVH1 isoform X1 n=1 Tax=Apium graveolens TaxID=4045 RepID=UPI003D79962D
MVQFHEHIISELLEDSTGGLVILSGGLSLHKLISNLVSLHHSSQGSLLILSASPSQKHSIVNFTSSGDVSGDVAGTLAPKISEISFELPAHHRTSLYTSGNVLFVTSRILIVDLLSNRVRIDSIAGLIILNVHNVSETSTEAFIVRIMRSGNSKLYVRAFSDNAQAMTSGFAKAEKILKCLYLRKLHLWPRFQVYVSQDLEKEPPEVVDVRVPMSGYMVGIQKAVIEVMDACLKEMRKTNKVDVEDLTFESGLFKSFDEIIRRQLDPIWHTLGKKTKQLVSDLKTLRKLLDYLVRYDAVTYLKYLDSLRASESFRSVWIFAESSSKIFEYAKKRVYYCKRLQDGNIVGQSKAATPKKRKVQEKNKDKEGKVLCQPGFFLLYLIDFLYFLHADSLAANTNIKIVLEEVLEEAPKWKVFREILEEIKDERQKQALSTEEFVSDGEEIDNGTVLVACKDEHSCMQLEECITKGPHKVMRDEWEKYLLSKVELQSLPKHDRKKKPKESQGIGVLNGTIQKTSGNNTDVSSISKQENDALLAAATELRKEVKKDDRTNFEISEDKAEHQKGKKRRATRNTPTTSNVDDRNSDDLVNNRSEKHSFESHKRIDPEVIGGVHTSIDEGISADKGIIRKHVQGVDTEGTMLPPVHFYAMESDTHILDILKPSVIIVYHPDVAFVREIEIYKSENPSSKLKVYFLFYDNSTEVQKFEASIRRENSAFESLIRQKSMMMMPAYQEGCFSGFEPPMEPASMTSQNSITRKAGGRKTIEKEMQVIVDMREFMSNLPNVLHQKGMRIVPVTLEVGDYILSPLICVERKSILDLFGSFASGRLYHQAEMMVRYYRMPVLLIEFSQDKSFSFQSAWEISEDVAAHSIISKLSLLALHFPRLRIVWSRSLHATAEIFASLKANQDEPDEAKALRVGVPSEDGIIEDDVRAENYNTSAVEFLRRLPGVTDSNYRALMDGCKSLSELATLPLERLAELMGGQKAAKTLKEFLDAKYPRLL